MAANRNCCCVPNCGLTRENNMILHFFPNPEKEMERFQKWAQAIGPTVTKLDPKHVYKNRRVCHTHFESKHCTWSRELSSAAIPTLLIPKPAVTYEHRAPLKDISNREQSTVRNLDPAVPSTSNFEEHAPIRQSKTSVKLSSMKVNKEREAVVLKKAFAKLTKKTENYAQRLKKAMNLTENKTFQRAINKFTTLAAIFTVMQFREINKAKMGRRFTQNEKLMALSLYKRSPRAYRWLQVIFVLPSPLTLNRLIGRVNLKPGINENLFKQLKRTTKNMKAHDKLCVLLFDEMSLAAHFDYKPKQDIISGFVNNGKNRTKKIADHALVFMIRGVLRNYKQPVAYTFCSGSTKSNELSVMIKEIIKKLHSVGFKVLATVCDQGATNTSAIKSLIEETKRKYIKENKILRNDIFEVEDQEVIPLFDAPHLIKGMRNNLMQHNLSCIIDGQETIAKWEHIVQLHQEDPAYKGIKLVKNLTEQHVKPDKFEKMKVKYATQVMSRRVASTIGYLAEHNILPSQATQTADVLLFFDSLFDSLNGSFQNFKKRSGKMLLGAVTPKSEHSDIWAKSKPILSSMKFVKSDGQKAEQVKTIRNFLLTINNVEYLKTVLFHKFQIKSFWMRHFNQDPLENFFGSIRSHGHRNINPTPSGFESSFVSLLVTNLTSQHAAGSNCEQDNCKTIFKSMKYLLNNPDSYSDTTEVMQYDLESVYVDVNDKMNNPRIKAQLQYVTGYILKNTKKNIFRNCSECKRCFYDKNNSSKFIQVREYYKNGKSLTYPSEHLIHLFSKMQDIITYILQSNSILPNIKSYMKTIILTDITYDSFTCEKHRNPTIEYMLELSCKFFIWNWTRDVNRLLKGSQLEFDRNDVVKTMAHEHYKKKMHFKK